MVLYGPDRQLWTGGPTQLTVQELRPEGPRLLEKTSLAKGSSTVEVRLDVPFDGMQRYGIRLSADGHRSTIYVLRHQSFLRQDGTDIVERDDIILRLLMMPNRPSFEDLVNGFTRLRDAGSPLTPASKEEFLELDDMEADVPARQLVLLNLDAKLRATRIDGKSLLSFVKALQYVEVDRLYIAVKPELKELVRRAGEFASAPGHGTPSTPIALPAHPDSWKHTKFDTGNIQLSFSETTDTSTGSPAFSVDVDIDLEKGIGHVFEWLRNNVLTPGHKTDQTSIYSLLWPQNILPLYTLGTRARAGKAKARGRAT